MKNIASLITQFLTSQPQKKPYPDYLSMKNGKLPLTVGYNSNPEPNNNYPTLKIDLGMETTHCQHSNSLPVAYSMLNFVGYQGKDASINICDNIIEQQIRNASLQVYLNKENQITKIEQQLGEIIQTGTVDVSTFSPNCITNITQYDMDGNPITIKNAIIAHQIKHYVQFQKDEILMQNKLPHPIRKKKKIKKIVNIDRKSVREIMEEFQILYSMFNSKLINSNDIQSTQMILDAVSLNDNSYQNLWDKIVGDIRVNNENTVLQIKSGVSQRMNDDQFEKAINRIVKQAVEYEKQTMDIEEDQQDNQYEDDIQVIQEDQQQLPQQQKNHQKEDGSDFQRAKIQPKTELIISSKYQYAIEDNSNLTNFYDTLPKQKFACSYPFELDQFQKRSILHLQKKQSIFVAAHTSAGKTAVAQYGIALAIKHKRKVIYTSPIKALSNQKYRELSIKFGPESVGIVTGDTSMNQQASCVIMTTQILRNNLYRGAEMIRDIQWVIFDQVHYINNQERGVVWEETIIMLPEQIGIIMLSATVPNYMDFANWVGRTKRRIVYVMKTFHRPVPLQHSLYIFNKFHIIKQANGPFLQQQYNDLHNQIRMVSVNQQIKNQTLKQQKKKKIQETGTFKDARRQQRIKFMNKNAVDRFIKNITKSDMQTAEKRQDYRILYQLIIDCNKKNLLPCVIFTFSKKKINTLANKIYPYDLTTSNQKSKIARMITSALANLKPQDQQIQQFLFLKMICINGYAVHHGDLLPLAKEIVQLLFSEGLIKVLFATETFAMGINMPTKTVIFNSIKKVVGSQGQLRFLNSSQYVQMSGRAGRRGLDEKGTVIIIVSEPENLPKADDMQKMVDHPGERLQSKFKVTYQIILNLLNSEQFGVTEMMRQSFLQNPKFSQLASNIKSFKQKQIKYEELCEFECPYNRLGTRLLMQQYIEHTKNIKAESQKQFKQFIQIKNQRNLIKIAKFLGYNNQQQIGLILKIDLQKGLKNRCIQIMIINKIMIQIQIDKNQRQILQKKLGIKKRIILQYDQDKKNCNTNNIGNKYTTGEVPGTQNQFHYYVYWIFPSMVMEIYENKIKIKFNYEERKQDLQKLSLQLMNLPEKLIPMIKSQQKQYLYKLFTSSHCHQCSQKQKHQHQYTRRAQIKNKLTQCAKKLDTNQLGLMSSFQGMLIILTNFGFVNQTTKQTGTVLNTLTLKGKIAKQVDIFVTEVIIQAILDPLDHAEIAALLSAFVCDYKPRGIKNQKGQQQLIISPIPKNQNFTSKLTRAVGKTLKIVEKITAEEELFQAYINLTAESMEQHILSIVNFHLTQTVYKWALGFDFNEARYDTHAPQGIIVRTIMRLSQLLSNVKSVCRVIGNSQLENKITEALDAIRRDIVFCQSLYLTG